MRLYKLTNAKGKTYGSTQWGPGVTHTASGQGELCGPGWIHAYTDPLLAVLLNPIHADFSNPLLWEAEGEVGKGDDGLQVGCTALTTIRQIPLPSVSMKQRIKFSILCALEVYHANHFVIWAKHWLDGTDRSLKAAVEAAGAAWATSAWAAGVAAAWAAGVAAEAAAWAASGEAAWAAEAAAWAATEAAAGAKSQPLDLIALAQKAMAE